MAARDGGVVLVTNVFELETFTRGFARRPNKHCSPVRSVRASPESVSPCSRETPVRSRSFGASLHSSSAKQSNKSRGNSRSGRQDTDANHPVKPFAKADAMLFACSGIVHAARRPTGPDRARPLQKRSCLSPQASGRVVAPRGAGARMHAVVHVPRRKVAVVVPSDVT